MAIVYQHRRKDNNEVFYVGIGDNIQRAYHTCSRNKHWVNTVKKVNFSVEILYENISWEEACKKEQELIKLYGRKDLGIGPLVNKTDGGDGVKGMRHSDEYKNRLRLEGPMSKEEVVNKWKNTIHSRTASQKEITKHKIVSSVFGKYTKEEIEERYKKMGEKMKGVKRPHTSQTMKGKPKQKIECPICGVSMSKNSMTRFHKNKCKV
jgi:hypothetical protein